MTKLATRLSLLFVALALPALAQIPAASVPDGFAQRMYSASWLEGNAAAVPYLVPTNATVPSGEAVLALARGLGADIPDGSTAQGMPSIGKLVVKTSPAAFAEIERLLGVLGSPAGERVEIAASLLVVADADFDAFLGRFGVAKSPAALLAPVLARAPSLDDLVDLAESPPAAAVARSTGEDGNLRFGGVARQTVGNDETAQIRDIVEYIFPTTFGWGAADFPMPGGGAVSNRAVVVRDPQDFRTRFVGPQFRVVPRMRRGDARIHLAVRFEHTGHPVWARIPSAGVPMRRADGSYEMVADPFEGDPTRFWGGETPEFPSVVEECTLDLADGEAVLLRPFPDPNAPPDAPRFLVPVLSARRVPDPVELARRAHASRRLPDAAPRPSDPGRALRFESWFARVEPSELDRLDLGWLTANPEPRINADGLLPDSKVAVTTLTAPQATLVLHKLADSGKLLVLQADPVIVEEGDRAICRNGVHSLGAKPRRSSDNASVLDVDLDFFGAAPHLDLSPFLTLAASVSPGATLCVGIDSSPAVPIVLLHFVRFSDLQDRPQGGECRCQKRQCRTAEYHQK